ncbi:hypothetical protein CDL15_Pgr000864 [Punica granatum]|uniref:Uncharacterized protein n=1 Tax=Punica granatum TaxID=22663 RepID=A0A218XYD8_PUNGR|nr:hypothetical protein CDL15_Pgr000864 [Punica granatum]
MWMRSPESSKYRWRYTVEMRWLALIAICRTIENLLDNGISLVMWDSSSRVEGLCTLTDLELESAVVPVTCSTCDSSIIGKSWDY